MTDNEEYELEYNEELGMVCPTYNIKLKLND